MKVKINRIDAFSAVASALDANDIKTANIILKVLSNEIKKTKIYSPYIEIDQKSWKLLSKYLKETNM